MQNCTPEIIRSDEDGTGVIFLSILAMSNALAAIDESSSVTYS